MTPVQIMQFPILNSPRKQKGITVPGQKTEKREKTKFNCPNDGCYHAGGFLLFIEGPGCIKRLA
jgi:hypothetical protein